MERKGDILYNLLDSETGQWETYEKVTTLPDGTPIDDTLIAQLSPLYRKSGTEYFAKTSLKTRSVHVSEFAPAADGVTDDSAIINKAISAAKLLGMDVVVTQNHAIGSTILTQEGIDLRFGNGGKFTAIADVNVIDLNKYVQIVNPIIDVGGVPGFSKAAIFCGNKRIKTRTQRTAIVNPIIYNAAGNESGYGIHFYSGDTSGDAVSFVQILGGYVHLFEKGIYLEQGPDDTTWVTGNVFSNVLLSGNIYHIYISGSDGNMFSNIEIQPFGNTTVRQLYCDGIANSFTNLLFWDVTNDTGIELPPASAANYIHVVSGNSPRGVIDHGRGNTIDRSGLTYSTKERLILGTDNYDVNVVDFLAYADKRFTVTQTSGAAPTGYTIANAFNPTGLVRYGTDPAPIEIEVDLGAVNNGIVAIGAFFTFNSRPGYVKIETYHQTEATWKTWKEITNNQAYSIIADKYVGYSPFANDVTKIRLTFQGAIDTTNRIQLERFWAVKRFDIGYTYFSQLGGIVEGQMIGVKSPDGVPKELRVSNASIPSVTSGGVSNNLVLESYPDVEITGTTIDFTVNGARYKNITSNITLTTTNHVSGKPIEIDITNDDAAPHTVTITDAPFPVGSDNEIPAGGYAHISLQWINGNMHASIVVYDAPTT